jgi:hypothetical protein
VTVGPDQAVGIETLTIVPNNPGEVLEVDLMDDARGRGHDAEIGECRLPPLEELISLLVALELFLGVDNQ